MRVPPAAAKLIKTLTAAGRTVGNAAKKRPVVAGVGLLALLAATSGGVSVRQVDTSGYPPTLPPQPSVSEVVAAFTAHGFPLPRPGQSVWVSLIQRNTPSGGDPPDPWDDWVGLLTNTGAGWSMFLAPGTAEPGWLPMLGKGKYPTHEDGAVRTMAPQYSPKVYGGGYHKWDENNPALRQIGRQRIERYDKARGVWVDRGWGVVGMNMHSTSTSNLPGTLARGVRDYSHGCTVIPDRKLHAEMLKRAGWVPDPQGIAIDLAAFLMDKSGRILGPSGGPLLVS